MMNIYYVNRKNGTLLTDKENGILCHVFEDLPFRIQKIVLNVHNPHSQQIIQKAKNRLARIQFNPINSSGEKRDDVEIRLKSFCGLIVEQLCFQILSRYNRNPNITIELDDSNTPMEQIDLKIHKSWVTQQAVKATRTQTVEIRSSFPFKPIEKVVAQDFDILGPYINQVKKEEIAKDFYLRFLFSLDYPKEYIIKNQEGKKDFSKTTTHVLEKMYFDDELNLKRNMTIYFVGGATNTMMLDETIAYTGNMGTSNFNTENEAQYRKIKIRNALDCIAIMQMMLNVIDQEACEGK